MEIFISSWGDSPQHPLTSYAVRGGYGNLHSPGPILHQKYGCRKPVQEPHRSTSATGPTLTASDFNSMIRSLGRESPGTDPHGPAFLWTEPSFGESQTCLLILALCHLAAMRPLSQPHVLI